MDTTGLPVPTEAPSTGYSQGLVIGLSVLVAAFGILSIVLLTWLIWSKCRIRDQQPDHRNNNVGLTDTVIDLNNVHLVQHGANNDPADNPGNPDPEPGAAGHGDPQDGAAGAGAAAFQAGTPSSGDEESDEESGESRDKVASLRKIKPQYSCRYARRSINVFSARESTIEPQRSSHIGLMQAAQSSYLRMFATDSDLRSTRSIESMIHSQMVDVEVGDGTTVQVPAPDMGEVMAVNVGQLGKAPTKVAHAQAVSPVDIRPKSFFHTTEGAGSSDLKPETDVSRGMFISKKCRPDKTTTVELYGVTLEIPAGALGVTETITLGILWSEDHQPNLDAKHAMISPIISCEPHGLKLNKPVTLTMPHCAHKVEKNWKIHIRHSETAAAKKPAWTSLDGAGEKVLKSKIRMNIDHFTLYTATGESSGGAELPSKWMELYAFTPPLKGTTFEVMIFCVNDYESEEKRAAAKDIKDMDRKAKRKGAKEVDSRTLLVVANQKNIELSMTVSKETSQWHVADMCKTKQELNFRAVWQSRCPESKYVLTTAKQTSKVMCCIQGQQMGDGDQVEIYVAEEARGDDWTDPTILDPVFPKPLRDKLVKMLDPKHVGVSNWEHLLDRMGKSMTDLSWLDDMYKRCGKSPTLYLLQEWVMMNKSLDDFSRIMNELGRLDIETEIANYQSSQTTVKRP